MMSPVYSFKVLGQVIANLRSPLPLPVRNKYSTSFLYAPQLLKPKNRSVDQQFKVLRERVSERMREDSNQVNPFKVLSTEE
jgi:hypothetical protein